MINFTPFPIRWEKEGIEKPTDACGEKTMEVCYLLQEFSEIPLYISPSKEGGLSIFYEKNDYELIIEVYNNLEIAAIVNDNKNKKIVKSVDIIDFNFTDIVNLYILKYLNFSLEDEDE